MKRANTIRFSKDLLQSYLNEVANLQPLPAKQEAVLACRIKAGDIAARDQLVEANLRFVIRVARKYQNREVPLSDLISEGNVGLITAAERFDETRGVKFITYAVWWIRKSILQTLSEHSRTVRLPSNRVERSSTKFSCNARSSEGYSGSEEVLSGLQVKVVFKSLPE